MEGMKETLIFLRPFAINHGVQCSCWVIKIQDRICLLVCVCTLKQVAIMVLKTLGPSILGTSFAVPVHEDIPSSFDI
jgi:hypothetical protein